MSFYSFFNTIPQNLGYIMKYSPFVLYVIIFLYSSAFAQQGNWHISLNNGLNYSGLKIADYPALALDAKANTFLKRTYRYGIGIKYELLKNFRVGVEAIIEDKGWRTNYGTVIDTTAGILITDIGSNYTYHFISFPLSIQYAIKIRKINFFAEIGYLINKRRYKETITPIIAHTIPVGNPWNGASENYGWMYGLGLEKNIYNNFTLGLISRYVQDYTGVGICCIEKKHYRHYNYVALLQLSYKIKSRKHKFPHSAP